MSTFAKGTTVTVAKSRMEIETMLRRYGVTGYQSGWQNDQAGIVFEAKGRRVRFSLTLPVACEFVKTYTGRESSLQTALEAEHRRLWRCLVLVIKAKLESVESGIETFEQAFLSQVIVPGTSETVGEWIEPQLMKAYMTGTLPKMMGTGR